MSNTVSISSYVTLRHNQIAVGGKVVFENKALSSLDFLNAAYAHFQIGYPKYFKMDNLCKTGFIAAELLLRNHKTGAELKPEETGIIISCAHGSLDTDIRYEQSTRTTPSPSLFVYTLPNILIGELSIRHRIKGESACFVFDIFDAKFQTEYVNRLFETGKVKKCISGWADYYGGTAEALLYLAEITGNGTSMKHDSTTVKKIFPTHE